MSGFLFPCETRVGMMEVIGKGRLTHGRKGTEVVVVLIVSVYNSVSNSKKRKGKMS